jgi:O-antigen/teichoic acid export membrane protein
VWYKLTDRTSFGMYISLFGAVITIVFNVVYLPKIGYMASAWATLITYSVMVIISYYFGKKYYRIPYRLKNLFIYLFLSTGFAYLSFVFFRGNLFISTLLVITFIGFAAWNEKKEIQQIIENGS